MKTILTVIKKEFVRFFKDYRFVLSAIILPGVMIYCVYSLMGVIMENVNAEEANYTPVVYVENFPEAVPDFAALNIVFEIKPAESEEEAIAAVKENKADLFIKFPQGLSSSVPTEKLNIEYYYNSGSTHSQMACAVLSSVLSGYQSSVSNISVNGDSNTTYDLADGADMSREILSMIVPMVLLMLLFSGCMPVASESIAGEKERGTMATLLVTPAKRSCIAIGKIAALACIALLSGLSSAVGLLLSLPKMLGGAGEGISMAMYGFGDYMAILGVILSTVLLLISIISIISSYAKSVKEASGLMVPLMILTLLCGVMAMFVGGTGSIGLFFIPIFNSALVISSVLSGMAGAAAIAVTICTNLVFTALAIFVLTLMFNSEKIMFNK